MSSRLWNVVLAAGEGTRMAPMTRLLHGMDLPKQFASFDGARTMLQATLDRIGPLAPAERTVVVVAADRADLARRQLGEFAGVDVAVQPANLGTGPGLMLPLARILAREPEAQVLVFPSDHHFTNPEVLIGATRGLVAAAGAAAAGVALIGVPAECADSGLGWIVPGEGVGARSQRGRTVRGFVEKPPADVAARLLASGALWNTLVLGGSARALWRMLARRLPAQAASFARYLTHVDCPGDADALTGVYADMPPADLSRHVLQATTGLAVVTARGAGWSDWGTPERLLQTLIGTAAGEDLLARLLGGAARPSQRLVGQAARGAVARS